MKKAILLSASKHFTKTALELLCTIKQEERMFVVGGFTHTLNYSELIKIQDDYHQDVVEALMERDQETVDENITFFSAYCSHKNIQYRVYEENSMMEINNLIIESRFADLMVVSNILFKKNKNNVTPGLNLKQVLHNVECPVLLLPPTFSLLAKIVIAYDGKKESMFAIKQFCYLFPQYLDLPVEIVYLNEEDFINVPQVTLLKEYVKLNFSSVNISRLNITKGNDFTQWASVKKDTVIIAGSYGRKGLFNSLPDSFIDPILENLEMPVFIAHH